MLGQLAGQVHSLVSAPLGHHHNTADLLHLRVIWRAHPVQVSCNLEMKGSETILSTNSECQNFFPFPRKRWFFKIQLKTSGADHPVTCLKCYTQTSSQTVPRIWENQTWVIMFGGKCLSPLNPKLLKNLSLELEKWLSS